MAYIPKLSSRKKAFFSIIVFFIVYIIIEILAQVAFRSIYGFSYRAEKLVRLTSSSWMVNQDDVGMPAHFSQLIIHPYMGFSIQNNSRLETNYGFSQIVPIEAFQKNDAQLRVLIVGGSVAMQLSNSPSGRSVLKMALDKELARLGHKEIQLFFSAALPGFKQPQQLLSHAYLASLGASFNLVINVDGFNEMTLAVLEGKTKGLHPAYPRGWDSLVGNQMTAGKLRSIGKLLRARDQQESTLEHARLFPRSAIFGIFFANRVTSNEATTTSLVSEIEHRQDESSLTLESGGPKFNLNRSQHTYKYLANLWFNSSLQLARSVEANGGRYLQVFQPNQYMEGSKPLSELEKSKYYIPSEGFGKIYREALPFFKTTIQKLEEYPWFSNSSMIYVAETETMYSDVCCHLNERGLSLLADLIAKEALRDYKTPLVFDSRIIK